MSSIESDERFMKHDVGEVRKRKHVAIYPPAKRDMSLKRTGASEQDGPQNLTPARDVEGLLIASTDDDADYMIQSNTPPLHAVPGSSSTGFGVGSVVNPERCGGFGIDMANLVLQQQQNLPMPSTSQQTNHGKLDKGKSIVKNGYHGLDRPGVKSSTVFTPVGAGTGNAQRSQDEVSYDKSIGSSDLFADRSLFDDECSSPVAAVGKVKLPVTKHRDNSNDASTSGGSAAVTAQQSACTLREHLDLIAKRRLNASNDVNSAHRGQNMINLQLNQANQNQPNLLSPSTTSQFGESGENSGDDSSHLFKQPDQIFKPQRLSTVDLETGFLATPDGFDVRQRHDHDDSSDGNEDNLFGGTKHEERNAVSGATRIPRWLDSPPLHSAGYSGASVRKHATADVNKMPTNGSGDTFVACNNGTDPLNCAADGYNHSNNVLPYRHGDYMPSSLSDREMEPAQSSDLPNLRSIGNSRMSLRQRVKPPDRFRSDDYNRRSGNANGSRSRWQDIAVMQQAQHQQLYSGRNPIRDSAIRGDRPSDTQSVMMEIHDDVSPIPVESPADDAGFRRSESFRRAVGPPRLPEHANRSTSGGKSAANGSGAGFVITSARSSGGIGIGSANVGTTSEADSPVAIITGVVSRYNPSTNNTAVIGDPTTDNLGEVVDILETGPNTDRRGRQNRHRHILNTRFDSAAPISSTSGRGPMRQDSTTASDDDLPPSRRGNVRGSRRREIKPIDSQMERSSRLDRANESTSGTRHGLMGLAVDTSSNVYQQLPTLRAPPPPLRTTSISNRRSSSATTTTTNSLSPSPDYNRGVEVSSSEEPEMGESWRSNLRRAARERRSARNYPLPPAAVMDESNISIPGSPALEGPSVARRPTAGRRQVAAEPSGGRSSNVRPLQESVAYTSSESSDSSNSTSNDSSIDTSLELTDSDDGEQDQGNDRVQQHSVEEIVDVEHNEAVDQEEGALGGAGIRGSGNRMRATAPPGRVPSDVAAGNRRALPRPPTLAEELPAQLIDLASRSISDSSLLDEDAGIDDSSWQPAPPPASTRPAPAGRRGAAGRANRPSAAARSSRRSQSAHAPSVATGDEDSDMDVEVLDENISNRTLQRIRQYEDDEAMARRLQAEFDAEMARVAGAAGPAAPSIPTTTPQEAAGTSSSHRRSTAVRARSNSPTPSSEASASPAATARNVTEPVGSRRPLAVFTGAGSRRRVPLPRAPLPSTSAGPESHRHPTRGGNNDDDNDDDDDDDGFGFNLSVQELLSAVTDDNFAGQAGGSSFTTARGRTRVAAAVANRVRNTAGAEIDGLQDILDNLSNSREREARTGSSAAPSTSAAAVPARGPSAGEAGPSARIRERRELLSALLAGVNRRGGESSTSSSSDNVPEAISPRPGPSRGNEPINIQNRGARYRLAASGYTARRTAGGLAGRRAANPHRILLENGSGVSIEIAGSGLHHLLQNRNPNATMDYDQMLRLTEALGDAVNPSLRKHEIDRIPVIKFTESMFQSASLQVASTSSGTGGDDATTDCRHSCQICMCEYEVGELLRLLPCFHRYHSGCIDEWFGRKANCPICRVDVRQHLRDNQHDSADDDDL